jgi:hypothetical protein
MDIIDLGAATQETKGASSQGIDNPVNPVHTKQT